MSETQKPRTWLRYGVPAAVGALIIAAAVIFTRTPLSRGPSMDFAQRQKVSVTSPLHFSFPEYMDHGSVEEALAESAAIQGEWTWDDEVLVLKPAQPLKAGESYTFVLPRSVKTAEGQSLGRDLEFVFVVAGPPKLAAQIPGSGSVRIEPQSKITLVFDRAMIPLTQVQGDLNKENVSDWPVTIDPPVEGRWRWMSTVSREFIPAKGLTAGTRYTVRVPKGIVSVAGDATEREFTWSFETMRPEVLSTSPESGDKLAGPTTVLSVTFNREVDLQSARDGIGLYQQSRPQADAALGASVTANPQGTKILFKDAKYGTKEVDGKTVTDRTTVVVVPQTPITFNNSYALFAAPGIKGLEGNLGTASGFTARFSTVGDLRIELGNYATDYGELQIDFSNPMKPETLKDGITIKPEPANMKDLEWGLYEWSGNRQARLHPELKPSTAYTVTVTKNVKDAYGQSLKDAYVYTFITPAVTPQVAIHSEGSFGIFEKGKPPVYYLNSVNVSSLDVSFAKLTLPQFLQTQQSRIYGQGGDLILNDKEGYKALQVPPQSKKDEWKSVPFDVAEKFGALTPGIYALTLTAPEAVRPYQKTMKQVEEQFFALTNLSITLKYSGDKALVWVTDMQTGNAVKNARIQFHSLSGAMPVQGVTDAQGFFESPMDIKKFSTAANEWEPEFYVTAQTDDDFAFVSSHWNDGVRPYNFDFTADFHSPQAYDYKLDSYLYTERPIYKAGDTVSFKGMVRLRDWGGKYSMPRDRQAMVRVTDAEGHEIYSKTLPISEYGSFSGSLPVDAKANLGTYYMNVQLTPEDQIGNNYISTYFSVLAYRKPEYKVEITPEREEYFTGETVKATIAGSYYFGAPMGSAKVAWRAQTTDYYFNKFTDGWYNFSLEDNWCWWECERKTETLAQGEGVLDAAGNLTVSVPVSLDDKPLSQVFSIEADITDANNQVVSNRGSVIVHKADAYVGVRSEDYVVTPGSAAQIGIVTVNTDGSKLSSKAVRVQLYSRTWNSIRKKGVDGEYYYENEPKDTFIRESSVTTDENGKAIASVQIASGGEYRVVAIVKDSAGREAKAGTSVYAWSSSYVNWPHTNSDRMEIVADKPEYKLGEKAVLLLKSPYQGKGVKALVTVEREGIMSRQVVDIQSNAQSIEIPVTEEMVPNAYVSAVIIKPRQGETFNEHGLDTGAPAYKVGYAKLSVDISSKRLNVKVETDKKQYLPGEKVTVAIKTTDASGNPIPADVSLGVVDMSLLALSSFETPDLVRLFYSERGLGVYTSAMLSQLLERFKPGSKGGGGGDPETKARGNFKDTAYWHPSIITNSAGEATATFTLPDNLTTWQLLAIGSTKTHTFGSLATTILETKNVIIRPVRPRFAVRGDKIQLQAIVHNFLPQAKTFDVSLTGQGFSSVNPQKVTVQPGQTAKLSFPVTVSAGTSMKMVFSAKTDGAVDIVEETIPVHEFGTMQSVATTGFTEAVAMEKVIAPTAKDASHGDLTVTVSPSMAAYLPASLGYLSQYPYGCTEQTISAFVPALALSRLQGFDQLQYVGKKDLETKITAGLERIYAFQRPDGGFGFWQDSQVSYPYLSAYVLYALDLAKDSGRSVDTSATERLAGYLEGVLRTQNLKDPLDLSTRAYILYALSEYGRGDISLLNNLYEQRNVMPLFARAHLALAYHAKGSAGRAESIVNEMLNAAKVDSRGTHFEESDEQTNGYLMNTNERTTALVLQAMLRTDPENALIPNIVKYMLSARKDGHWGTTQSTVHALLAFADYLDFTDELSAEYTAGVEVNGKKVLDMEVTKELALQHKEVTLALDQLTRGAESTVKIGKTAGPGRLYYDMLMSYFYVGDTIQPAEEGIGITRRYTPLSSKNPALKVGDTYLLSVTVTVPEDRNYVAVEAPLPAGMELVDLTLETSQQNLFKGVATDTNLWSWESWKSGLWRFNHHEFRDDQLFLFADQLPAGVYEYRAIVRATQPGTFRQRPAKAYEMYFPEVFGQTEGGWVTIAE
jgi:alpha-2-macroglobulin